MSAQPCPHCSRYVAPGKKTDGDYLVFHLDEPCPKAPQSSSVSELKQ